jgi:hypothetical protein
MTLAGANDLVFWEPARGETITAVHGIPGNRSAGLPTEIDFLRQAMLKQLRISNFTAFGTATFDFSPGLNVIVGANATGKTHVLKLGYLFARAWPELKRSGRELAEKRTEAYFEDRLMGLFRPERLNHLLRHGSTKKTEIAAKLNELTLGDQNAVPLVRRDDLTWQIQLDRDGDDAVKLKAAHLPDSTRIDYCMEPIFVPSKEIVSLFEGLIGLFEKYEIQLDETYRDLAVAMSVPERRTPSGLLPELLEKLSAAIGGELILEKGRLLLRQSANAQMEPHLLAEGFRKLGLLLYLVRNQIVEPDGTLFWDEPEANLNPGLMRPFIEVLVALAAKGVQIVLATHSLFVLREIEILLRETAYREVPRAFFALMPSKGGVKVAQGASFEDVDPILSLEEDLAQSGRFMDVMD